MSDVNETKEAIKNNPNISEEDKQHLLRQVDKTEQAGQVYTDDDTDE